MAFNISKDSLIGSGNYKEYISIITQTAETAPSVTVLSNSLSGTPTFARTGIGVYTITLTGEWTADKTFMLIGSTDKSGGYSVYQRTNTNTITLYTYNTAGSKADGLLTESTVQIRVYT